MDEYSESAGGVVGSSNYYIVHESEYRCSVRGRVHVSGKCAREYAAEIEARVASPNK